MRKSFLGGINFSIISENSITPMRSLFLSAEKLICQQFRILIHFHFGSTAENRRATNVNHKN